MKDELLFAIEKLIDRKLISNEKEYLDVQEACFFLGISKSHLYKLNFRKIIPYYKSSSGKKVYYLKKDLIKYLTEYRFMSKSEMEITARNRFQEDKGGGYVR